VPGPRSRGIGEGTYDIRADAHKKGPVPAILTTATRTRCPIRARIPSPVLLLLAVPSLVGLAGCNDTTVSKYREPPVVAIENPTDGAVIEADIPVTLQGRVVDESYADALHTVSVLWTVNGGRVCDTAVFDTNGISTCEHTFDPGVATVTLTATDPAGQTASATIELTVEAGNAPAVEILTPSTGDRVNDGDIVLFTASVSDVEDRADELTISWESDLDGVLSSAGAASSGDVEFATDALTVGTHSISLNVTDKDGNTGVDRLTLFVNGPPEAPTVAITPDPATSDDNLRATVIGASYDPNGDDITYTYEWYQNGALTTHTGDTVPAASTNRGDVWQVVVTPTDSYDIGPSGSDDITIDNAAPSMSAVTITPTTAYTSDVLTAVATGFSDSDGDTEGYHYQWAINGVDVTGATDPTLDGSLFVKGDQITVTAWPWDGTVEGTSVTSGVREIQNSLPTAPTVAIDPEYPEDDDALTCTLVASSTDADGDTITYTYAWNNNGTASSVTSDRVSASYTSDGDTWECIVTPNDGTADGTSGSDTALVGDYTAPDAPVLSSIEAYRNEDTVTIVGTSEAYATVTLYWTSSSGAGSDTTTASAAGTFTFSETLTRGVTYSFYANATDASGNISGLSNTVSTEACTPWDEYEDSSGYGDTCTNPIIDWSTVADNGATSLSVVGNLLNAGDSDWYLVQTSDAATSGINYYRFHVELVDGSGDYAFVVYEGGCSSGNLDCSSGSGSDPEGSGYTEYEFFAQDNGEGGHGIPGDYRSCSNGSASYNNCDDLSSDYYIHIIRLSAFSCANYELEITNGTW
jgi:hypothetical protein